MEFQKKHLTTPMWIIPSFLLSGIWLAYNLRLPPPTVEVGELMNWGFWVFVLFMAIAACLNFLFLYVAITVYRIWITTNPVEKWILAVIGSAITYFAQGYLRARGEVFADWIHSAF